MFNRPRHGLALGPRNALCLSCAARAGRHAASRLISDVGLQQTYTRRMNSFEAGFALLGLSEERRQHLASLAALANPSQANLRAVVIETVIVSNGQREVTARESALAKLVRTPE